jgi:DNA polymerase I-like protein with 3'-5' exonuclease and polymerase domains
MSGRRLPPTPKKFEQNDLYKFKRGFASKVPAEMARTRFNLNPGKEDIVWLSPDGKSIMSDRQANLHNSRRRSALNTSDAWRDLKKIEPEKAKEIGWNNFQKLLRNIKGSRVQVLKRLEKVGIDIDTIDELARASDGEIGDNTGWGDSG